MADVSQRGAWRPRIRDYWLLQCDILETIKNGAQPMGDAVLEALILDLLEWLSSGERSYAEVMDAWRTSCPKLPVWEDATDRGLVTTEDVKGRAIVRVTSPGLALLERRRPTAGASASEAAASKLGPR